jgi:hypothetical protein
MVHVRSTTHVPASRPHISISTAPLRFWGGLALVLAAWWLAWFGSAPYSEHTFFSLWLGCILLVDGHSAWRTGTSLLARGPRRFVLEDFAAWSLLQGALLRHDDRWLGFIKPRRDHEVSG